MAYRCDIGTEALRPPRRLPDGRLVADARLTRVGVFSYYNADGSERRELRLPEDVFRADSLESFALAPLTDDHPPRLLDAQSMKHYAKGAVGNVRRDGDHVRGLVSVFDDELVKKMDGGKIHVSVGYGLDLLPESGVHPLYGRYDARQTNIQVNHVAIVDRGRAGDAVVRMDSAFGPIGTFVSPEEVGTSPGLLVYHIAGALRAKR